MDTMESRDILSAFEKGKVNAYLDLGFSVRAACPLPVFRTPQRAGGVRNIFASQGRKGPGVRERCVFEFRSFDYSADYSL